MFVVCKDRCGVYGELASNRHTNGVVSIENAYKMSLLIRAIDSGNRVGQAQKFSNALGMHGWSDHGRTCMAFRHSVMGPEYNTPNIT